MKNPYPSETGCCPQFDPEPWDEKELQWANKLFFEGPYKNTGQWCKQMAEWVRSKGKTIKRYFMYYTTCPKCAKQYGKNYVVILAEV